MCFVHVVNLSSGHVIQIVNPKILRANDSDDDYDGAIPSNPMLFACSIVKAIWALSMH